MPQLDFAIFFYTVSFVCILFWFFYVFILFFLLNTDLQFLKLYEKCKFFFFSNFFFLIFKKRFFLLSIYSLNGITLYSITFGIKKIFNFFKIHILNIQDYLVYYQNLHFFLISFIYSIFLSQSVFTQQQDSKFSIWREEQNII